MDFFSLLILVIIGVLVIGGLLWWLSSRKRNERYRSNRSGYAIYRDDPPLIKRRSPETYPSPSGKESVQVNVITELRSVQARLSSLENRMASLEQVVRRSYSGGVDLGTRSDRTIEETSYPVAIVEPFEEKPLHADFLDAAKSSYQRLSVEGLRNLSLEPLFVFLDVDESARGSAIGEAQRIFKQSDNKQNAFVIFPKGDGEGWLFPNPRISYTESMGYVFPDLSYENFTESKHRVDPIRVRRTGENVWEILIT